jgi:elongation factor Ts
MECRDALINSEGDLEKAAQTLKEKGLLKAEKKANRETTQGLIEAYIHAGGRVGALVELNCETDFVAKTDEFKALAHDLAMQVTAMSPEFIREEDIPKGTDAESQTACLLLQPFIKDPDRTIQELVVETIAKTGENIKVGRFTRFELGS